MFRASSRLSLVLRNLSPSRLPLRVQQSPFSTNSVKMSGMTAVSAKDACPRESFWTLDMNGSV